MPGRHSLFWKLAIILVGFCLVMIALTLSFGQLIGERTSYLSDAARTTLRGYAHEAERAWREGGRAGVDAFQADLERREGSWVLVLDQHLFPWAAARSARSSAVAWASCGNWSGRWGGRRRNPAR